MTAKWSGWRYLEARFVTILTIRFKGALVPAWPADRSPTRTGPVEADGAVDAQNAPTAPWKTLLVFHELPQGVPHQITHDKPRKSPESYWETRIDPRFAKPPYDPGRSDFPSPVLTLACPPEACPGVTRFKRWLTYAPATTGLPLGSSPLRGQRAPGSVSGRPLGPPSAQSPFARRGCDPRPSGVPHRFDQRYPVFVAPTGSCARPKPSRRFRSPYTTGLRRLRPAPAGRWSFPTLFPAILVWVLGPLPRGALQVRLSVPSLETPVFAPRECARRTKPPRTAAATRYLDFGAVAIPFPFRPPHSLDLQAAPTAAHLRAGRPGRLHHASPGWLPAPGCGIASCPTRTIDTAGLPPAGLQLCRLLLAGPDIVRVIPEERAPGLTGWPSRADGAHVFLNRPLADVDAELEQLAANALGTPETVGRGHRPDEFDGLSADGPAPALPLRPSTPDEHEQVAMPAQERIGLHHEKRVPPRLVQADQ